MDQAAADAILQAAGEDLSLDELSDVEVDADGSSSLSEIEDKDGEGEEEAEASDALSDEENDSEAETERIEDSPHRPHQDVVLSSQNHNQIYERSPSKLNKQINPEEQEDDEDEEPLSDDDISINESPDSPKSPAMDEAEHDPPTATTSLQDSSGEGKKSLSVMDDTKKRKRSIMDGGVFDVDLDEPVRKRTALTPGDDYAIEDDINHEEEVDNSNPISGDVSGDEAEPAREENVVDDIEDPVADQQVVPELPDSIISPKKRGRKKKKGVENGVDEDGETGADGEVVLNGNLEVRNGDDDHADNEAEDEAALKNEEERELMPCNPAFAL